MWVFHLFTDFEGCMVRIAIVDDNDVHLLTVCSGSWTQGEIFTANFDSPVVCINNVTTANMCSTSLQFNNDGGIFSSPTARGDTVFVKVDCGTHAPLPIDQQDPAYQHDGVALPRTLSDAYSQVFAKMDSAANATISVIPAPSCANQNPAPTLLDCLNATAVLVSSPQTLVLHGKNGGKWWSSVGLQPVLSSAVTWLTYIHSSRQSTAAP